jgi:DNA-binding response OmpR family regulator
MSAKPKQHWLIEAGADDSIRKPIDLTRLLARIRATLRRAAA